MMVTLGYLAGFIGGSWLAFMGGFLAYSWSGNYKSRNIGDAVIAGLICAAFFSCGYLVWMVP